MGGCASKADRTSEKKETPIELELKVEKRGLVELQDKITYEGEWLGENKHGYGIQRWPDGAVFKGNFSNGVANGYGIFIHTDGDKYEGEWKNDRAHGFGTYTHSDGSKYVGEWRNDKKHGKAIESWVDGSNFEGSYAYGLKQGFGKFSWHDGSKYIGNFDANQINGYGVYYWNDGRVYTGCWLKNHMFGFGKFDWTDHRCYEGQYINDKKDGDGKFTWPDGRAYIGQWKNGKQHGIGIFYNARKEGKVGEWKDGSRLRWIKSSLENDELVGEGLTLREEYSRQREELLKANGLYENYRKLPKNNAELQQMRVSQEFDECLATMEIKISGSGKHNNDSNIVESTPTKETEGVTTIHETIDTEKADETLIISSNESGAGLRDGSEAPEGGDRRLEDEESSVKHCKDELFDRSEAEQELNSCENTSLKGEVKNDQVKVDANDGERYMVGSEEGVSVEIVDQKQESNSSSALDDKEEKLKDEDMVVPNDMCNEHVSNDSNTGSKSEIEKGISESEEEMSDQVEPGSLNCVVPESDVIGGTTEVNEVDHTKSECERN